MDDDKTIFDDSDVINDEHDEDGVGVGEPASWRAWGKTRLCWLSLIMELVPTKPARRLTSVIRVILIFE